MMKTLIGVCALAGVLLAGCTHGRALGVRTMAAEPLFATDFKNGDFRSHAARLGPPPGDACRDNENGLDCLVSRVDAANDRGERDRVVARLLAASAQNCENYLLSLRDTQVTARTGSSLLGTGLGIAGGLATPERSANLLSGLAGLMTGAGAVLDRNVFAEQGIELITIAIRTEREKSRAAIVKQLQEQSYSTYPLGLALADVFMHHGQCSVMAGLSEMSTAVRERDQAVRTINQVTAELVSSGASAQEIAAAITGVARTRIEAGELLGSSTGDRASSVLTGGADLERGLALAKACISLLITEGGEAGPETEVKAALAKPQCEPSKDWRGRQLDILSAGLEAPDSPMSVALLAAKGSSGAERQATLVTARRAAMAAAQADHDALLAHRSGLDHRLRVLVAGDDPGSSAVVQALEGALAATPKPPGAEATTSADGSSSAASDPLISAMLSAARAAQAAKATGRAARDAALDYGRGYLRAYAEPAAAA